MLLENRSGLQTKMKTRSWEKFAAMFVHILIDLDRTLLAKSCSLYAYTWNACRGTTVSVLVQHHPLYKPDKREIEKTSIVTSSFTNKTFYRPYCHHDNGHYMYPKFPNMFAQWTGMNALCYSRKDSQQRHKACAYFDHHGVTATLFKHRVVVHGSPHFVLLIEKLN